MNAIRILLVYFCIYLFCCCLVAKSCLTVYDPMGYSVPGFSVHEISLARMLEWVGISFPRSSHLCFPKACAPWEWERGEMQTVWKGGRGGLGAGNKWWRVGSGWCLGFWITGAGPQGFGPQSSLPARHTQPEPLSGALCLGKDPVPKTGQVWRCPSLGIGELGYGSAGLEQGSAED